MSAASEAVPYSAPVERRGFTDAEFKEFVGYINSSGDIELAAAAAGIEYRALLRVLTQGKLVEEASATTGRAVLKKYAPNVNLWKEVKRVRAVHAIGLLSSIKSTAKEGNFKAAVFLLQNQLPTKFGGAAIWSDAGINQLGAGD